MGIVFIVLGSLLIVVALAIPGPQIILAFAGGALVGFGGVVFAFDNMGV